MALFYLVRHGEARYDLAEERRLIGAARDLVPLTDYGREQAESVALNLKKVAAVCVVTSPMTRAMETALIISRILAVPLTVEFDLHEWIPDLQFRYNSTSFALEQSAEMSQLGGEWPVGETRPWEPLSSVRQRVISVLSRYTHETCSVVVTHGIVIEALTRQSVTNGGLMPFEL